VLFAGITTANDVGDEMLPSSSISQRKETLVQYSSALFP
jgi:hypothetical protein